MTAQSGCPDEAAGQKRSRTLRGSGIPAAARTGIRIGRVLRGLVALRARVPILLGGYEPERVRLRSLRSGGAGPGAALRVDDVLAGAVCPPVARGSFGCFRAARVG